MKKLLIYGDSILRGVTYSDEKKKYTLCLGHNLECLACLGLDIQNNSRMGATIERGYDIMLRSLTDCDEDTMVLFEFGGNDCDYKWKEISDNPRGDFLPNTPKDVFLNTYRTAIRYARSKGAKAALTTLVPLNAERYMNWISRDLSYENILSWLGDVSMLYRWQEYYSRLVDELAAEFSLPILDLRQEFLLSHRYSDLLATDGIHPSDEGHKLIEASMRNFFAPYAAASVSEQRILKNA